MPGGRGGEQGAQVEIDVQDGEGSEKMIEWGAWREVDVTSRQGVSRIYIVLECLGRNAKGLKFNPYLRNLDCSGTWVRTANFACMVGPVPPYIPGCIHLIQDS